jgi:hypothetical protein
MNSFEAFTLFGAYTGILLSVYAVSWALLKTWQAAKTVARDATD